MKAILLRRTGDPSALEYVDVPTPQPREGEVLVKADTARFSSSRVPGCKPDGGASTQATMNKMNLDEGALCRYLIREVLCRQQVCLPHIGCALLRESRNIQEQTPPGLVASNPYTQILPAHRAFYIR